MPGSSAEATLVIRQGQTFQYELQLQYANGTPQDISASTVTSSMADYYGSNTVWNFTVVEGSNASGKYLSLDSSTTSALDAGRYVFDVRMTDPSGNVTFLLAGEVQVDPAVTTY
jgi:hypothetical protein